MIAASGGFIGKRIATIPDEDDDVAEEGDEARGEELVQGVDVGRQARHEPADGRPVVEGDVGALQVAEDGLPEVVHDPLAHPRRPRHHHEVEDEARGRGQEKETGDRFQAVRAGDVDADEGEDARDAARCRARPRPVFREEKVDGGAGQERPRELSERLDEEDSHRTAHVSPVGTGQRQEPPEEARLEGLAERLFLLGARGDVGHQAASTSSASRCRSASSA